MGFGISVHLGEKDIQLFFFQKLGGDKKSKVLILSQGWSRKSFFDAKDSSNPFFTLADESLEAFL